MARQRRFWLACAATVIALVGTVTTQHTLNVAAAAQPSHGLSASSVIYSGQIHVFELQSDAFVLEHAWWDGSKWNHEYLDGPGIAGGHGRIAHAVGFYNSAVVYNGQLQDFYFDASGQLLRHAWWDGSSWNFESLDGAGVGGGNGRTSDQVGGHNSAVVYSGQLQDFYNDSSPGSRQLRHAWWDGSSWHFETLDATSTNIGQFNSAIVYNGQLQDFYYDVTNSALRHAWWSGSRWNFEYLDGTPASTPGHSMSAVGKWNSSVIYNGQLHDFYEDEQGFLRHAWWNGSGWQTEELDGNGHDGAGATDDYVGEVTATTIYNGQLQIFYADDSVVGSGSTDHGPYALRHAWYARGWTRETLDGPGSGYAGHNNDQVGGDPTFQGRTATLIYNGQIQVFTEDQGPPFTLEHDWWNGSNWGFEQLQ